MRADAVTDKLRVGFRVDASGEIGTGHFMRCLTLADSLKKIGADTKFLCRHIPPHLKAKLLENGHALVELISQPAPTVDSSPHAQWLGTSQEADAGDTIRSLAGEQLDWLFVDHYALDSKWESLLRDRATNIFVIDDLADRHHICDVLLDQNYYNDIDVRYSGKVPAHCRLLLGPRYALLRSEFATLRTRDSLRRHAVKRILVFFGGVDARNLTRSAVDALVRLGIDGMHVDVVIGAGHPERARIESDCATYGFDCHVQTDRMGELMAAADLAVGAGGSAIWERCCVGVPTLSISTAYNQVQQVADAASAGLVYAPDITDDLVFVIQHHLRALIDNSSLRSLLSRNSMLAVDGRGVARVIGTLGYDGVSVRTADESDSNRLFEWRNHPSIRSVSSNPNLIGRQDHEQWFASVLHDPQRLLFIGECQGVPVGVVRFDIRKQECDVSIYLDPTLTRLGLGQQLLRAAESRLIADRPNLRNIRAQVLGSNKRSHVLFVNSGYHMEFSYYSKAL